MLYKQACRVIPGGVNSPVRAFAGVGGNPVFFKQGAGAYLIDVDDKRYIDYVGSWGPLILGHCHPAVVNAVMQTLQNGMSFGAPTKLEIQLAYKITQCMPAIEKIRMVNSGTEATMTAIRLARGYTGKTKIIKFIGCYHGHNDNLLVNAGSGMLTLSIPASPGVLDSTVEHTLVADFNDLPHVARIFEQHSEDIAAIIVEPVAGNMGLVLPVDGFLSGLRDLCNTAKSLLIFDEVMTGFRISLGGAQELYDVIPDLTTLGKIIGGGMPVGAIGGRADVMSWLAPEGPVYQAGTLSGNPMAMAAGLATLHEIESYDFYNKLSERTSQLVHGLLAVAADCAIPFRAESLGGMFGFSFNTLPKIINYKDVMLANAELFRAFFWGMLNQGIYLAPSMYEAGFVSSAHGEEEINLTIKAAKQVLSSKIFDQWRYSYANENRHGVSARYIDS